ncbi:unnamed protein product [Amoebophrya sp. A120]|nr:unnamed protein product [Amoebophrya sp. A120]|eukprot:GSA120T00000885001.1
MMSAEQKKIQEWCAKQPAVTVANLASGNELKLEFPWRHEFWYDQCSRQVTLVDIKMAVAQALKTANGSRWQPWQRIELFVDASSEIAEKVRSCSRHDQQREEPAIGAGLVQLTVEDPDSFDIDLDHFLAEMADAGQDAAEVAETETRDGQEDDSSPARDSVEDQSPCSPARARYDGSGGIKFFDPVYKRFEDRETLSDAIFTMAANFHWDAFEACWRNDKLSYSDHGEGSEYAREKEEGEAWFARCCWSEYVEYRTDPPSPRIRDWTLAQARTEKRRVLREFGPMGAWDVSGVESLRALFCPHYYGVGEPRLPRNFEWIEAVLQDFDITSWNTAGVLDMSRIFRYCRAFNGDVTAWDVSSVEDFTEAFYACGKFNQPLGSWDTRSAKSMNHMFYYCKSFAPIDPLRWNVKKVADARKMFAGTPECWRENKQFSRGMRFPKSCDTRDMYRAV